MVLSFLVNMLFYKVILCERCMKVVVSSIK